MSTSAITVPVLPSVMAQADTASVAAASLVGVEAFGVIMYHWPLAPADGTYSGSSGMACG